MALDSKHPDYVARIDDWKQMRNTYIGERRVKDEGFLYLSPTSGMVDDGVYAKVTGSSGWEAYKAYRQRARFPDWVRDAVDALLGVMHRKPPVIELPSQMEPMRELATTRNESLEMLLQRISLEQLVSGRLGLMADVISQGPRANMPFLALYEAEDIINWDEGTRQGLDVATLNLVVLNETHYRRGTSFDWQQQARYRVLVLGDPETDEAQGLYSVGVFDDTTFDPSKLVVPEISGQTADEILFEFVNTRDLVTVPDIPPLLGLSNLALTIYRGEADYRQALFMQGQDTLVVIGAKKQKEGVPFRVGAGGRIDLPDGGDAKFIGVDSAGLPEQRLALENDRQEAMQKAGQLLDSVSRERESAAALRVRVAARTATLNQIAITGAYGLQSILRKVARWMGLDDQQVVVTPNLDFVDDPMTGEELAQLMGARIAGAPLSLETVHRIMVYRGMTEMTFEDEVAKVEAEREADLARAAAAEPDGDEPAGQGGQAA